MIDPNVVIKRNGVDAYGLFVDYIRLDDTGTLVTQERAFLSLTMLCTYSREKGNRRGVWEAKNYPSHAKARDALMDKIRTDGTAIMTAPPKLVELVASDIQSIANGEPPHSRHAGAVATEREMGGKIDDDDRWDLPAGTWDDIDEDPF